MDPEDFPRPDLEEGDEGASDVAHQLYETLQTEMDATIDEDEFVDRRRFSGRWRTERAG